MTSGTGVFALKPGSKRRRTQQQIIDQKEEARLKQEAIEAKLAQLDALTARVQAAEQKAHSHEAADLILRGFMKKGMA